MAEVIVTLRVMPSNVNTDLEKINEKIKEIIKDFGKFVRSEIFPVAFGLNQLNITFIMQEDEAENLEVLENKLREIDEIESVETIDVRRAIG